VSLYSTPPHPAMPHQLVYSFDCVSPWSYIGYHVLQRYTEKWPIQIDWHPASLAYVMKFANNQPPVSVPNKGAHMVRLLQTAEQMYGGTPAYSFSKTKNTIQIPFQYIPSDGFAACYQGKVP